MKKLALILTSLSLLTVLFSGCEGEPPVDPVGPTIAIVEEAGFVLDTATIKAGETFSVKITTSAGDSLITRLEVTENGTAIDAGRLTFGGFAAGSNPTPIAATDGAGFTWEIDIVSSMDVDVTNTYGIKITDGAGLSNEVFVDITTNDPGTPVVEATMVMLLNQGGPTGTGGLDLHTGTGTGTDTTNATDQTADIRDMGIDLALPNDQNWRQTIGVINGSKIALPPAGFDFDAVATQEEIPPAYELGTQISVTDSKVQVGDVFLVLSDGTHFAIKVTAVNPTAADNNDSYEFSVKQ